MSVTKLSFALSSALSVHSADTLKQHANWDVEQWKLIPWSDESKVNDLGSNGRV